MQATVSYFVTGKKLRPAQFYSSCTQTHPTWVWQLIQLGIDLNATLSLRDFSNGTAVPTLPYRVSGGLPASYSTTQRYIISQFVFNFDAFLTSTQSYIMWRICRTHLQLPWILVPFSQPVVKRSATNFSFSDSTSEEKSNEVPTTAIQSDYPPSPTLSEEHEQCSTATQGCRRSAELTTTWTSETFLGGEKCPQSL